MMEKKQKVRYIRQFNGFLDSLQMVQGLTGVFFVVCALLIWIFVEGVFHVFWLGLGSIGVLLLLESFYDYIFITPCPLHPDECTDRLLERKKKYFIGGHMATLATIIGVIFSSVLVLRDTGDKFLPSIICFTLFAGLQMVKFYILQYRSWILLDELSR